MSTLVTFYMVGFCLALFMWMFVFTRLDNAKQESGKPSTVETLSLIIEIIVFTYMTVRVLRIIWQFGLIYA